MRVRASLRLRRKPDSAHTPGEQVDAAADELKAEGFTVLRAGRTAISVEAEPDVFRRALGVDVEPGQSLVVALEKPESPLADLVDLLEITPKPNFFTAS
jgi:hypothetical protein